VAIATGDVRDHARVELVNKFGLSRALLVASAVAKLAGVTLSPGNRNCVSSRTEDSRRATSAGRGDVSVVGKGID